MKIGAKQNGKAMDQWSAEFKQWLISEGLRPDQFSTSAWETLYMLHLHQAFTSNIQREREIGRFLQNCPVEQLKAIANAREEAEAKVKDQADKLTVVEK